MGSESTGEEIAPLQLGVELSLYQRRNEKIEVCRIDVADGKDAELPGGYRLDRKTGVGSWQCTENGGVRSLRQENGHLVLVNSKDKQCGRLAIEIGEVCTFEDGVLRQACCVGKIEAERKTALKPGFDGMAISGDHLWDRTVAERGQMLVEKLGGKRIGLMDLTPAKEGHDEKNSSGHSGPASGTNRVDARGLLCLRLRMQLRSKVRERFRGRREAMSSARSCSLELCRR